ncbi:MAG TPA: thioredoxin domain-containing protein [Patescibacteria group bacterium]|nr:thioredoxin domain-containing protein [Patescibacteria group bacterium]
MQLWRGMLAAIAAVAMVAGTAGATGQQARTRAKPAAETEPGPPEKTLGSPNAPIVMEVFSDYSCPVCRVFYENVVRPMVDDYISTGKVYLIHRDFPLTGVIGHEHSRQAALYETAAARIGRFQEVDAALYARQADWTRNGNVDAVVAAVLSPKEMKRVRELVQGGKVDSFVNSDRSLGDSKGVHSTPTIYVTVHGHTDVLPGNVSYSLLRRYLDEQLQK